MRLLLSMISIKLPEIDVSAFFNVLWNNICKFMYALVKKVAWIVDFCQSLFRKLAGLDTYYFDGKSANGDIIELLIQTDIIRNLFISILVLGIILLLIVTFVSVWKTEWEWGTKEGNSKTKIFQGFFRALFNFIAVPVISVFGIFMGNALLKAIDGATGGEVGGTSITNSFLVSLSADAVRYNYQESSINKAIIEANLGDVTETNEAGETVTYKGIYQYFSANGKIDANTILKAFDANLKLTDTSYRFVSPAEYDFEVEGLNEQIKNGTFVFSYENDALVNIFFDYTKMNYIVALLILVILIMAMLSMTFNLVQRLFEVTILFVISPPVVAMSPINPEGLKKWRQAIVSKITLGYAMVAAYNIFMSIFPIFKKITLFSTTGIENFFVQMLFVCVGLLTIDSISKTMAGLFGVGDLQPDKGTGWGNAFGMAGKVVGTGAKVLGAPIAAAGKIAEYNNIRKYSGLGDSFRAIGSDIKKTAKTASEKGVMKDFWKNAGASKATKPYKSIKEYNEKHGITDAKNTVKIAKKSANKEKTDLEEKLGIPSIMGKKRSEAIQNLKTDKDSLYYQTYYKTRDGLAKLNKQETLSAEEEQAKKELEMGLSGYSAEERKKMDNTEAYFNVLRDKKQLKNTGKATKQLYRDTNNVKQSKKATANSKTTQDSIARQLAKEDAAKEIAVKKAETERKNKEREESKKNIMLDNFNNKK